jgi:hypothetical protein
MPFQRYTLSSFLHLNELNDSFAVFNEKYSKTFVLNNNYLWIIRSLKLSQLSVEELFDIQPINSLNMDELTSVIEEFLHSNIVVKTS